MKHQSATNCLLTAFLLFMCTSLGAENRVDSTDVLRPVTSTYAITLGGASVTDTYLSPINYSGWSAGFRYNRRQAMNFNPDNWIMQLQLGVDIESSTNPAGNSTMLYAGLDASWAMMRRWKITPVKNLSVGVGPQIALNVGCLYLSRNGNNPASAKASVNLGLTGYAAYRLTLWRLPVIFRYQPSLPVIGAFFSPDYGELYYEIYLGNHRNLAHCAWWGNYFAMINSITADIQFGGTWLTLGYESKVLSTHVNDLTTNQYTNSAIIGISGEWMSLNPRRKLSPEARIISATY